MPRLKGKKIVLQTDRGAVSIERDKNGVPHIEASTYVDLLFGLGWVHACDRLLAMELTRLIGRGEAAEHLEGSPELIETDRVMRKHRLWLDSVGQVEKTDQETKDLVGSYCKGVNDFMKNNRLPFEFKLIRHVPEPWTPADCFLILRMMGLVDLAETQGWMEKLIVQAIKDGVPYQKLKELCPYLEDRPDDEYMSKIKNVKLESTIVPPTITLGAIPRLQSSNNWAVSGKKTASGKPIMCGDPHLDSSRLPAIWQEVVLETEDNYFTGATVPGIPAPALGRTAHLAWSPTYGCTDVIDHFIEEVKDGRYRRGSEWKPFKVRNEIIRVKGGEPLSVNFYENEHGILEGEPKEDGFYLCFAMAMAGAGAADMEAMMKLMNTKTASEAMGHFASLDFGPFNWVIADGDGNIAYQLCGPFPVRKEGTTGLLPLPGWDKSYDWKGLHDRGDNPSVLNPPENYFCTANQDLNKYGAVPMMDLPMADDRAARIAELLQARDDHTVGSMKAIQYDLKSKQAEKLMEIIRPLLPDSENGRLLKEWDSRYDPHSSSPTIFENVYRELLMTVFGENGLGREAMAHLLEETIIPYIFYGNFDGVLLREESSWFGDLSREDVFKKAIGKGLDVGAPHYGSTRKFVMKNLLLGGRLPRFLGFDYGPIELPGSRGTVSQGQIFRTFGGREANFSPTYRFIADFSEEGIHSVLAGGPSDRRFSKWYTSGIEEWLKGVYKRLLP